MSTNIRLENPGDYQGTFALLVGAALEDVLSDGFSLDAEYTTRDEPKHIVRANIVRYEGGQIFLSGGGDPIPVVDLDSLHF